LSSKSVQNVAMTVHRMLRDAVRWGRIARNPADMSDPPRSATRSPQVKAWTAATLRTFLELTRGDELWPLWLVMATTGLRRGEALGLRWADIDFDTGRVRVTRTVTAIGWDIHHGQPKTAAGRRPVALDPATVVVLADLRRDVGRDGDGLVFCDEGGEALHPERVYQAFKRAVKRHRLPPIALHGLRHTWATIALEQGVHPRVVQERLGHSNIAITLQTYSHVMPTMHDDAAATVAALITPKPR
jgi:integrase